MVKKSAYKYILGGTIIFFILLALLGFVLPFYTANFNGYYGDYHLVGTITISGLAMVFGLNAGVSGEFIGKTYTVIPQISTIFIFILLCASFILAVVAICYKNKDSFPYAFINAGVGILSLIAMIFSFTNHMITGITLSTETPGFNSEGMGYGAILSGFSFALVAVIEIILVFITIFVLAHQAKNANGDYVDPSGELEYKTASRDHYIGYHDPAKDRRYQIEEQPKKEEKKPFSSHLHSSIDIFGTGETSKPKEENKPKVDPLKAVDPNLSFQDKLASLKKMHDSGDLSDADYTKFRDQLISDYINNGGK